MKEKLSKHSAPHVYAQERTDAQLVKLARDDDKYAFNLLMERYQIMASCIALRMVSNEENAHDLVQEAMLQAFLSLDRLRDDERFKSWFYGIVLNVCRNWRREVKADTISLNTQTGNWLSEQMHIWDELIDPQEQVEIQELHMVLDEALAILSLKNRIVAQLFYYEEMSIQEIAQKLALSQTAIKNRLFKSREQLRAYLLKNSPEMIPTTTRKRRKDSMIKVTIAKVVPQDHFRTLVMLQDREDNAQQRILSIWLKTDWTDPTMSMRMSPPRPVTSIEPLEPLTTDFMVNILKATGSTINRIEIEELQDEILYAKVYIDSHGEQHHLKARLNDAVQLALRLKSELYVADAIMEKLGQKLPEHTKATDQIDTLSNVLTNKMHTGFIGQTVVTRKEPHNLDFSDGLHGWWFIGFPKEASTYQIDQAVKHNGKASLAITNQGDQPALIASLHHEGFLADNYLGKRLRLRTYLKTEDVKQVITGVEINGPKDARRLRLVNAPTIHGTTDWTAYEVVFDVSNDTALIKFFLRMMDKGTVWLGKTEFEIVDSTIPLTDEARLHRPLPQEPQNTHFAHNLAHWDLWGSYPQDYTCGTTTNAGPDGATCGYIKSIVATPRGNGILRQMLSSKQYQDKYVRLVGNIKTLAVEKQASLYIQLDGVQTNEVQEKSLQGTNDWSEQDVTLFIPEQAGSMIRFGVILHGKGQIWLDNVRFEIVESDAVASNGLSHDRI